MFFHFDVLNSVFLPMLNSDFLTSLIDFFEMTLTGFCMSVYLVKFFIITAAELGFSECHLCFDLSFRIDFSHDMLLNDFQIDFEFILCLDYLKESHSCLRIVL